MPDTVCDARSVPPVDFSEMFNTFENYAKTKRREEIKKLNIPDMYQTAAGGKYNVRRISGDEVWKSIYDTINEVFPECWLEQAKIVEALIAVNVRRVYGDELDLVVERLMKDNGWDRSVLCNLLLIICPRRFGKTRATEVVVAALMMCVPGFNHVHFALQKKFGKDFVNHVREIIDGCERGKGMFTGHRQSQEEIILQGKADVRRLRILTADSKV